MQGSGLWTWGRQYESLVCRAYFWLSGPKKHRDDLDWAGLWMDRGPAYFGMGSSFEFLYSGHVWIQSLGWFNIWVRLLINDRSRTKWVLHIFTRWSMSTKHSGCSPFSVGHFELYIPPKIAQKLGPTSKEEISQLYKRKLLTKCRCNQTKNSYLGYLGTWNTQWMMLHSLEFPVKPFLEEASPSHQHHQPSLQPQHWW